MSSYHCLLAINTGYFNHTLKNLILKIKMSNLAAPVATAIRQKLSTNLNVLHLDVLNESHMHNVPKGSETHFKVVVVSEKFSGVPLIKRHRIIHDLLKDELQNGVHALSIEAKTPDQWTPDDTIKRSPPCKGGFGL
ncbi:hypothetical protein PPYR_04016 [Photinus pyralis]|uniref:BolA-like protein DDB_G0274169 n=2 Tax=Photinus pyralis TaxID=7054 RepID=A0A5N4AXE6_PHOPY|nr:bolA-like protein DDB_G0274169 isoform X1 [Photinus pyralis]KAB0801830.1 hypothetical protein PPYR_04016 [Photinus pyralis]